MAVSKPNGTNGTNGTNGQAVGKAFPAGVHVPSLTWFSDNKTQEIDWKVQTKHLRFLIESGSHGSMVSALRKPRGLTG